MKKLIFLTVAMATAAVFAAEQKLQDMRPEATADKVLTGVEWEKANDAKLAAYTTPAKLAAFVANPLAAKALLAQLEGAYRTDSLSARQIAAVSQWVMLPDPWYCLFWDGEHATGRKVWVRALLTRAETAQDAYIKEFCLDQLRWCGCDCPDVLERIRAIGTSSGDKAVSDFAEQVVRELEKKSIGLPVAEED